MVPYNEWIIMHFKVSRKRRKANPNNSLFKPHSPHFLVRATSKCSSFPLIEILMEHFFSFTNSKIVWVNLVFYLYTNVARFSKKILSLMTGQLKTRKNSSTGQKAFKNLKCSAENEVQELWQGVCRRVRTLFNCPDYHLFNLYKLLKNLFF